MSKWISIKKQIPPQREKIKIRAQYHDHETFEAVGEFSIVDIDEFTEAWKWILSDEEQKKYGTLRPTHWMPLPEPLEQE